MKLWNSGEKSVEEPRRTLRVAAIGALTMGVALLFHKELIPYATEHGWRGDGGIGDVWSHAYNVSDSILTAGSAMLASRLTGLFHEVPLKRACVAGAIGIAAGFGANVVVEVPMFAETAAAQHYFPNTHEDKWDAAYGGATSVTEATILVAAMLERKRPSLQIPPTIATTTS